MKNSRHFRSKNTIHSLSTNVSKVNLKIDQNLGAKVYFFFPYLNPEFAYLKSVT